METVLGGEPVTLNQLKRGERAVVAAVSTRDRILHQKLLTMGLVTGTTIQILGVAPLGDPVQIQALGYKLSLRISEAQDITVVPV